MVSNPRAALVFLVVFGPLLPACKKDKGDPTPGSPTPSDGTISVSDVDGHTYEAVRIGDQWWMTENLRTSLYSDGSNIPEVLDANDWGLMNTEAWCNNPNVVYSDPVFGKFYNWYAVNDPRGLCPMGWHVPTEFEWQALESYLGMPSSSLELTGHRGDPENVGGKLKSLQLWHAANTGASNESGFSALPNGFRDQGTGQFEWALWQGVWWTATEEAGNAWYRGLFSSNKAVNRDKNDKGYGFCVRCVMD